MAGVPDDRMTTGVADDATHVSPMSRLMTMVGARGIAPRPPTFRSRCASPSHRSPSTGCGAHDATVARRAAERATDREVGVVAAVLVAGSEKAAAHRLGLSHSTVKHHLANARSKLGATTTAQLVWILAPRLPGPEDVAQADE